MYQISRAIYRDLAPDIVGGREGHAHVVRACECTIQRLVTDRRLVREFGPILDAQSVRLQNAQDRLTDGVHPDYWLYLTELRGVRDRVKDVVAEARHARPR